MKARSRIVGLLIAVTTVASPFLPAASAAPPAAEAARGFIVGGHDATEGYSFMGSMQNAATGAHRCGAALIDPRWLVTAAHCVSGESPSQYRYRIGSTDRNNGGELATPEAFVVHPGYDLLQGRNDIALVRLTSPVNAAPITMADASPKAGTATRILGWGLTCPMRGCGDPPVTLQELDTSMADPQICSGLVPMDAEHELCVGDNGGTTGACFGDSGSPALVKVDGVWRLVGLTSRAQSFICALFATIYTDSTTHTDWITSQIRPHSPETAP